MAAIKRIAQQAAKKPTIEMRRFISRPSHVKNVGGRLLAENTFDENRWDDKAGLRRDAVRSQVIDVLKAQVKRRPAMKEVSIAVTIQSRNSWQQKLTIGLDLTVIRARAGLAFSGQPITA